MLPPELGAEAGSRDQHLPGTLCCSLRNVEAARLLVATHLERRDRLCPHAEGGDQAMHLSLHCAVVHRDLEVFNDGGHCACHDAMQGLASVLSPQGQGNGLFRDMVPSKG